MKKGKLVVVSGPSAGVGKDTILKMFLEKHSDWNTPISVTTRQPRTGELNGHDYNFVTKVQFEQWQRQGKFMESVLVDNNQWYGTLRQPVEDLLNSGKNVIIRKDVRGCLLIKDVLPDAILVFINAESWEALEQRIRTRGTEDESAIKRKLELAKTELPYQNMFDHVVINPSGHPEKALAELESIIGSLD